MIYEYNGIFDTVKKKNTLINGTTWMNLKNIMLSEISQTQKTISCMIPLYEISLKH